MRRIELLGHRYERNTVLVENLHHFGEVQQRSTESVNFVNHYAVNPAGFDVVDQSFERRSFGVATGKTTVVVPFRVDQPAFVLLARDQRFRRVTLGIERIELLVEPFFGGHASVNGTAD